MTAGEKQDFASRSDCLVCELTIYDDTDKVREHNHTTGKYRGPAHKKSKT